MSVLTIFAVRWRWVMDWSLLKTLRTGEICGGALRSMQISLGPMALAHILQLFADFWAILWWYSLAWFMGNSAKYRFFGIDFFSGIELKSRFGRYGRYAALCSNDLMVDMQHLERLKLLKFLNAEVSGSAATSGRGWKVNGSPGGCWRMLKWAEIWTLENELVFLHEFGGWKIDGWCWEHRCLHMKVALRVQIAVGRNFAAGIVMESIEPAVDYPGNWRR